MRILLLNQNHIGDALFTTPAIAALRCAMPEAYIVNAAVAAVEPLFHGNPNLSDLRVRPATRILDYIRVMSRIRRGQFDTVVSFSASSTIFGVFARLSGAHIRIGFDHPATRRFHTHAVPWHDNGQHHVQDHLDQMEVLAPVRRDFPMEVYIQPTWQHAADRVLAGLQLPAGKPLIGLNPGATVDRKKWPADRWAALADRIISTGCQPLLFGGPCDAELTERIRAAASLTVPSTQGSLSLGALAAAAARCAAFVSGDTGPMHVAVAVGTPVIALHGPTDPARTGPYTANAVVIYHAEPEPENDACGRMETITVDEVERAVRDVVGL